MASETALSQLVYFVEATDQDSEFKCVNMVSVDGRSAIAALSEVGSFEETLPLSSTTISSE